MMKPRLLHFGPLRRSLAGALEAYFSVANAANAGDFSSDGSGIVAVAVSSTSVRITQELFDRLPDLRVISTFGVGFDHIPVDEAHKRGILVSHTPDVLDEEVADTTVGLLLETLREIPQAARYVREGRWEIAPYPLTRGTLRGRTVGILGLGRIGRAVGKRLEGFGIPIYYHSRRPVEGVPYGYCKTALALAEAVDTLIVLVPGGPETANLVDAAVLDALGVDGVLINVARGTVVDDDALLNALQEGRILGAGLDVFRDEPRVPEGLRLRDDVVLLPHAASASIATRRAMDDLVVANLVAWLEGRPLLTPVRR